MGSLFRSEEMALAQLFIQPEAAYYAISELGEQGVAQFRDLNEDVNNFQRKYVNEVRRCDEMERMVRYIEAEVQKDKIDIPNRLELPRAPNPREIIDLEAHLEKTEGDILELSESAIRLKQNYLELTELRHVLDKTETFLEEQDENNSMFIENTALMAEESQKTIIPSRGHLGFIAGVINRERVPAFELMLWRISRGNVFLKQAEIGTPLEDPVTGDENSKTVFTAYFQGDQLKSRIMKVCTGFRATIYPCPNTKSERMELKNNLRVRLEDLNLVLNQTNDHRSRVLVSVAKELQSWSVMVKKMKAIYHTLNMFNVDVTQKCLIGECWVPKKDRDIVQQALSKGSNTSGSSIKSFMNIINTTENPPTFNQTNKFTQGFQNLIDSYGVASYRELNPALYTIITFPFLFAVMFGDLGHGIIMLLFGAWMVIAEKKLEVIKRESEVMAIFFSGRYIVVLMGLFSIYTGIIYNDVFSKSFNIFGSSWYTDYNQTFVMENHALTLDPRFNYDQEPYPIGLDPVWQVAENKIIFLNSYKMKLSIIFGVIHMIFGVCLSVVNYVHFRKYIDILLVFLPQVLFLMLLFLWMVIMMFMKWIMYNSLEEGRYSPYCAPSVLILFINMMLFKKAEVPPVCNEFLFDGQKLVQMIFVVLAVLCIPVMLFGKPIYIAMSRKNRKPPPILTSNGNQRTGTVENSQSGHDEHEEPMSEIMIEQAIHTVEYVLSTISHTASYLRLWALSLAHAQLSEVLWNMVLSKGLMVPSYVGSVMLFIVFAAWAVFTIGILVMMEGLSAFLHTLRLHWVEFMSKFYSGLGYPFQPFCFRTILEEEDNPDK